MTPNGWGILVIDGAGETRFASGLGAGAEVQTSLRKDLAGKRAQASGMLAIEAAQTAVVVYCTFGEDLVFLLRPAERHSAIFEFVANVDFAESFFNQLLASPYNGMVVVDDHACIRYMAVPHRNFLKLSPGDVIGRKITEVLPQSKLPEALKSGKAEYNRLLDVKGSTRLVSRIPIRKGRTIVGAFGQVMFNAPEHVHHLSQEVRRLRQEVDFYRKEISVLGDNKQVQFEHMLGESDAIRQLKSDLLKVAPLQVPVLIVGESGTGKELAAKAIHALSSRNKNRMVIVNAAAIPGNLVEAELFGYESGSFTGAEKGGRRGKFELAHNGSIFFDEMGDLPQDIQVKLLRVLQDGTFERVGGQNPTCSDFRLISASNRNFEKMVANEEFRMDLYYRISGVTVRMPSLRERLEDLPILVESFLVNFARRHNMKIKQIDRRVYDYLREQPWPGNIRQLRHEVEKAAIFCNDAEITIRDFRLTGLATTILSKSEHAENSENLVIQTHEAPEKKISSDNMTPSVQTFEAGNGRKFHDAIDELEKKMISDSMVRNRGNKKKTAEELGISRAYLYKKISST